MFNEINEIKYNLKYEQQIFFSFIIYIFFIIKYYYSPFFHEYFLNNPIKYFLNIKIRFHNFGLIIFKYVNTCYVVCFKKTTTTVIIMSFPFTYFLPQSSTIVTNEIFRAKFQSFILLAAVIQDKNFL